MELTAAIEALAHVRAAAGAGAVYTDSTNVIKGITAWIRGWRRDGCQTREGGAVLNRELWQQLDELASARPRGGLSWHYVRGHVGIAGNERVDAIADGLARGATVTLYSGPLAGYDLPIFDVPDDTSLPVSSTSKASGRKSGGPVSYLSLVDGHLMRHATWAECESRVKGRSGARFKKVASPSEETAVRQAWGCGPD
jgi:ribonuclease HI